MKPIPGVQGYFADERGIIWSHKKGRWGRFSEPHPLAIWIDPRGYANVTLYLNSGVRVKRMRVNRLVCLAYYGQPPSPRTVARHLNGDKLDNRPENLAWGSQRQNKADELKHGTRHTGEAHYRAKMTNEVAAAIKAMIAKGMSNAQIEEAIGVKSGTVSQIRANRQWKQIPWPDGCVSKPAPYVKLNSQQVAEIQALVAQGTLQYREIAKRFGVSDAVIRDIRTGRRAGGRTPER